VRRDLLPLWEGAAAAAGAVLGASVTDPGPGAGAPLGAAADCGAYDSNDLLVLSTACVSSDEDRPAAHMIEVFDEHLIQQDKLQQTRRQGELQR
jgi:hypothetical protein